MTDEKNGDASLTKPHDRNAMALETGKCFEIYQTPGETDDAYRVRLASELRARGKFIEAHEVFSGRRYDDPEQGEHGPMAGIFGYVAQTLHDINYRQSDPRVQLEDDIVVGGLARSPSGDQSIRDVIDMLGPEAGIEFLDAMRTRKK